MASIFYDHLINWEKMTQTLTTLGVSGDDRLELIETIEESLHTEILILILNNLPLEVHESYIENFHNAPYDQAHFEFISLHSDASIEELIRDHSSRFFDDLLADFLQE